MQRPEHGAVEHVERREQGGGAVALVVVGRGRRSALLYRQPGLGALEGLDLRLLVDGQHDRVRGRVDVEPDHVAQLGDERRVPGQLEGAHAVRGEPVRGPDALHRAQRDPGGLGHHAAGPVRRLLGRVTERQLDHPLDGRGRERRDAGLAGLVMQEAGHALAHEALLPAPHARLRHAGAAHHLVGPEALGRGEDDHRSPGVLLGAVAVGHDRLQAGLVGDADVEVDVRAHTAPCHGVAGAGIL
jgi:hypothetical protein